MSGQPQVRIVVVDDQEVVRAGFGMLLDTQPDFTVVGSAADGAEAIRVCRERPAHRWTGWAAWNLARERARQRLAAFCT